MAIEIDNNTVLKFLARRGSNVERLNIVLTEGEPGWTVDTKRLYMGDGGTVGGIAVGMFFLGSATDITTLGQAELNDIAYKTDTGILYRLKTGDGTVLSGWEAIGGPGFNRVDGQTIDSDGSGYLFVNLISGANIDSSALGTNLTKEGDNIALSAEISVDRIITRNNIYLQLPNTITINDGSNTANYSFPATGYTDNYHLVTDSNGNLSWAAAAQVVVGSQVFIPDTSVPVGAVVPYFNEFAPTGWLLCTGQPVLSTSYGDLFSVIGTTYGRGANADEFLVPNLTGGMIPYGIDVVGGDSLGYSSVKRVLKTTTIAAHMSAIPSYYIIKWKPDTTVTTNMVVLSSLSAFNTSTSQTTTAIGLTGQYTLNISVGDVGTGNKEVIDGFKRGRVGKITSYTTPGTYEYIVPAKTYQLKVTCTGAGGIGYHSTNNTPYAYSGGAGGSVIAYVNTIPGESWKVVVGAKGTPTTSPSAGWGGWTEFSLSGATVYKDISAGGAWDDSVARIYATQRGGWSGGVNTINNGSGRVITSVDLPGGDGGFLSDSTLAITIPPAASMYGPGPAYGGGGGGVGDIGGAYSAVTIPGDGICIVEEVG